MKGWRVILADGAPFYLDPTTGELVATAKLRIDYAGCTWGCIGSTSSSASTAGPDGPAS